MVYTYQYDCRQSRISGIANPCSMFGDVCVRVGLGSQSTIVGDSVVAVVEGLAVDG